MANMRIYVLNANKKYKKHNLLKIYNCNNSIQQPILLCWFGGRSTCQGFWGWLWHCFYRIKMRH